MQNRMLKKLGLLLGAWLLALLLVPMVAHADEIVPGGISLSIGYEDEAASGDGWSYDGNHTLTLDGYNGGSIVVAGQIVIKLEGTNHIQANYAASYGLVGICSEPYTTPVTPGTEPDPDLEIVTSGADLGIVGPGSLTIDVAAGYAGKAFGIAGNNLTIGQDATLAIVVDSAYTSGRGIDLKNRASSAPHADPAANYAGEGTLIVHGANLSITAEYPLSYIFDLTLSESTVSATSPAGNPAVGVPYAQGSLTLSKVRGAYLQTTEDGSRYLISTVTGRADEILLVPGESTDHEPGWAYENDGYYYYDENGQLVRSARIEYAGHLYYVGADGRMMTSQWVSDEQGRFYVSESGVIPQLAWVIVDGAYYFAGEDGYIWVSRFHSEDGVTFRYLGADGKLLIDGSVDIDGFRYVADAEGVITQVEVIPEYFKHAGTCGTCTWLLSYDGVLIILPTNGTSGVLTPNAVAMSLLTRPNCFSWHEYASEIVRVEIRSGVSATSLEGLFMDCVNLVSVDVSKLDTSGATSMAYAFYHCSSLTALDISNFTTAHVTKTTSMFDGCLALTTLTLGANFRQPTSNGSWAAIPGTSWKATSNGQNYWGYELAHRVAADTYVRQTAPYIDGWHVVDGRYYFFTSDGVPRMNSWIITTSGKQYYLDYDGRVATNKLVGSGVLLAYVGANGEPIKNQWKVVNGYYYYFDAFGYAYYEMSLKYNGAYYYFGADCKLCINRWVQDSSGNYYYFGSDGKMYYSRWVSVGGTWYYIASNGILVKTGWAPYNGRYLYFYNYTLVRNTYRTIDGVRYYFDANGYATRA